jgi:hypothetical protein
MALRNGIVLLNIMENIDRPFGKKFSVIDVSSTLNASSELVNYQCVENIQKFLNACKEKYSFADADLFAPEDLLQFSLVNFGKVHSTLTKFFEMPQVNTKIQQIVDHQRATKSKKSTNAASGGNLTSAPMTPEDFMKKVTDELFVTENKYVADLDDGVNRYYLPIQQRLRSLQSRTSRTAEEEVLERFSNMPEIADYHREIYSAFQKIGNKPERVGDIANIFTEYGNGLIPLYEKYCSAYADYADTPLEIRNPDLMAIIGVILMPAQVLF